MSGAELRYANERYAHAELKCDNQVKNLSKFPLCPIDFDKLLILNNKINGLKNAQINTSP
jgi:hypothetical protein